MAGAYRWGKNSRQKCDFPFISPRVYQRQTPVFQVPYVNYSLGKIPFCIQEKFSALQLLHEIGNRIWKNKIFFLGLRLFKCLLLNVPCIDINVMSKKNFSSRHFHCWLHSFAVPTRRALCYLVSISSLSSQIGFCFTQKCHDWGDYR